MAAQQTPGNRDAQRSNAAARFARSAVVSETRAGRLSRAELRTALAAPASFDGFTSRWYRVSGLDLHVRERPGNRQPACVLVHGLAVSHRYLMPTARRLDDRYVLVPDLPGFGLSTKPRSIYRSTPTLRCWAGGWI